VTVIVGEDDPVALGVPEITPVLALIDKPAGRPLAVQLYGVVPAPAVIGVPG
jgi:hypothetical protein